MSGDFGPQSQPRPSSSMGRPLERLYGPSPIRSSRGRAASSLHPRPSCRASQRERAHRAPLRAREWSPSAPHPRAALRAPPGSRGLAGGSRGAVRDSLKEMAKHGRRPSPTVLQRGHQHDESTASPSGAPSHWSRQGVRDRPK